MNYLVLAYYLFNEIKNPLEAVAHHKAFLEGRDVTSRIYISEQGINGQMSASRLDAIAYMEWLITQEGFEGVTFKVHSASENVFPRLTIKYRKQLVAIDREVDLSKRGEYLTPSEWRKALESNEKLLLIDVRNDYETVVGHFEGAVLPPCRTFREFNGYADTLKENFAPDTRILMCCTGGIRCEVYSAVLKEKGFEDVSQLKGGIIQYGLDEGTAHWKGKLFVFDDRLTVALDEQEESVTVGCCKHCNTLADVYYNCANMDCNDLFLCCKQCSREHQGCCCDVCKNA
ncbi:MAG: rhodanese-related sulfurtransferase, partial [Chlamydiota bacterium]